MVIVVLFGFMCLFMYGILYCWFGFDVVKEFV